MVLYIGYTVTYETACKLFRVSDYTNAIEVINAAGLDLYSTDKGQYILGLRVKEVSDLWDTFVSVDDALILIQQQKKRFTDIIQREGIDLSDFMLERMEEEPLRVHNPPPYLITT